MCDKIHDIGCMLVYEIVDGTYHEGQRIMMIIMVSESHVITLGQFPSDRIVPALQIKTDRARCPQFICGLLVHGRPRRDGDSDALAALIKPPKATAKAVLVTSSGSVNTSHFFKRWTNSLYGALPIA